MKSNIVELRNLGPQSQKWLGELGILNVDDLRDWDLIDLCWELRILGYGANLNLLYALWGALNDCDWRQIPATVKSELSERWNSRVDNGKIDGHRHKNH